MLSPVDPTILPAGIDYQPHIVYGEKDGMGLLMERLAPPRPNGCAIVFLASGGMAADRRDQMPSWPRLAQFALDHRYTVFMTLHGSAPRYRSEEIVEDVKRAVRFVRFNANHFHVDPEMIGAMGISAGGHLALMLATGADRGLPETGDPVDAAPSHVRAAVSFCGPTDLMDYDQGASLGPDVRQLIRQAFFADRPPAPGDAVTALRVSPLRLVTPRAAPCLLIHGELDELVPYRQAKAFHEAMENAGVPCRLITKSGIGHGWANEQDFPAAAQWFDRFLLNHP